MDAKRFKGGHANLHLMYPTSLESQQFLQTLASKVKLWQRSRDLSGLVRGQEAKGAGFCKG